MVLNSEDWTTRTITALHDKDMRIQELEQEVKELKEENITLRQSIKCFRHECTDSAEIIRHLQHTIKDKDKIIDALRDLRVQK